jgi:hypothetical protein
VSKSGRIASTKRSHRDGPGVHATRIGEIAGEAVGDHSRGALKRSNTHERELSRDANKSAVEPSQALRTGRCARWAPQSCPRRSPCAQPVNRRTRQKRWRRWDARCLQATRIHRQHAACPCGHRSTHLQPCVVGVVQIAHGDRVLRFGERIKRGPANRTSERMSERAR